MLLQEDFLSSCSDPGLLFILVCMLLLAVAAVFVQSLSLVWLIATPWTVARQISPSFTVSQSLLKVMSIESGMPSKHLILLIQTPHPLLLLYSIIPSIRVFSNESALPTMWPKYWSFSFSISISHFNEYSGLISFRTDLITLQPKGLSLSLSLFFLTEG